ncbi:MAG: DUF4307 domain-containing protein [Nocardioidaceae bacterium]
MTLQRADGPHQSLADRYGAPSPVRRVATVAVLGLLVAAFLSWLLWAALHSASTDAGARVRSYDVVSPHEVRMVLDVHRPENAVFVCTVTAQAADHAVVGEREVRVPPGEEADVTLPVSITTDREATTAFVSDCS